MNQWQIGDKALASNDSGDYIEEPCTVIGFKTNTLGMPLVKVRLDELHFDTIFYPNELRKLV